MSEDAGRNYSREREFEHEESHLEEVVSHIDHAIGYREGRVVMAGDVKAADKLAEFLSKRVDSLRSLRDSPYFGRIDYSGDSGETSTIYIGDVSVVHEDPEFRIISRNSPIASLYYRPSDRFYEAPTGKIKALVRLKRTLTVEDASLIDFDDVLRLPEPRIQLAAQSSRALDEKLGSASHGQMVDAAQTIQPEQYEQIAATLKPVLIVQGAAGSGKSLVGLHRLDFILSPFSFVGNLGRPHKERVIMFGPSPAFLKYVSGLLPGLGIGGVRQTTVAGWMIGQFSSLVRRRRGDSLFADLMNNRRKLREEEIEAHAFKTGLGMKRLLDNFVAGKRRDIKERVASHGDILFSNYPEWGVGTREFENRAGDALRSLPEPNRARERFISRLAEERVRTKPVRGLTPSEGRDHYRRLVEESLSCWPRIDFRREYVGLLNSPEKIMAFCRKGDVTVAQAKEIANTAPEGAGRAVGITDLAAILYLDYLINGFASEGFEHVVVDEAQDISPLEITLMKMHSVNNTFTILGDLRQSVIPYKSIANWNQIATLFERGSVARLESRLTYRSTQQITQYANRILQSLPRQTGMPIPYERKGERPRLVRSSSAAMMRSNITESVSEILKHPQIRSVAVLTKWRQTAVDIAGVMEEQGMKNVGLLTPEGTVEAPVSVGSIILTKGLEFDAVVVANAGKDNFNETDFDRMLLYLACTRARHQLEIHWYGTRSPIVPDVARLRA